MIDISTLTRQEQEALYEQLRVALGLTDPDGLDEAVPEWHQAVLRERLAELARGDAEVQDWPAFYARLRGS